MCWVLRPGHLQGQALVLALMAVMDWLHCRTACGGWNGDAASDASHGPQIQGGSELLLLL